LVVFVTAYDEYALRAFDAAALDYLVKPVRRPRLRTALTRARERLALQGVATTSGEVAPETPPRPDRLLIDRGHHLEVLAIDEIDWIEAADNHVIVHAGKEAHRFRRTMEQVVERLPADRFVRIHRSTIVNLNRIRQVAAAEDHAPDSRVHKRACAHSAWLLGDIKIAIRQTPIANGRFSLCQRQHFGVRGRVLQ